MPSPASSFETGTASTNNEAQTEHSTKDDAHDLMRHKFLGHETKTVGQTEITKLRSTTELDKGEMTDYMTQIDNWCVDHGCLLPKPEDSEYQQIMREMGECA